jgi:hypothetical protein
MRGRSVAGTSTTQQDNPRFGEAAGEAAFFFLEENLRDL